MYSSEIESCDVYNRSSCSSQEIKNILQSTLVDFNRMLDEEVSWIPLPVEMIFEDVAEKLPQLNRTTFRNELLKRCNDSNFIERYFNVVIDDGMENSLIMTNMTCNDAVSIIIKVLLDEERETTGQLVDVIKKVQDMIAFENLRRKNRNIGKAFRLTKTFYKKIIREYLSFIKATSGHSKELYEWYRRAEQMKLELPMRAHMFFNIEILQTLTNEIMGIDIREKEYCLWRAWQMAISDVPIPSRLMHFLYDLRSMNVTQFDKRVYVRPAYTLLLLNTNSPAILDLSHLVDFGYNNIALRIAFEIMRNSEPLDDNNEPLFFSSGSLLKCIDELATIIAECAYDSLDLLFQERFPVYQVTKCFPTSANIRLAFTCQSKNSKWLTELSRDDVVNLTAKQDFTIEVEKLILRYNRALIRNEQLSLPVFLERCTATAVVGDCLPAPGTAFVPAGHDDARATHLGGADRRLPCAHDSACDRSAAAAASPFTHPQRIALPTLHLPFPFPPLPVHSALFHVPIPDLEITSELSMFGYDDAYGYSTALLAVAPLATQLALTPVSWIVFFPLFAIPAASLILSVGNLSTHGPVLTYKRLAPIASGDFFSFFFVSLFRSFVTLSLRLIYRGLLHSFF
uniref:3'-5' exonuclease domain-containing protein n=1 Tax=Angiostrongylus cantonensis TaxID=6313 RepID=A0A158PCD6_ANGCA